MRAGEPDDGDDLDLAGTGHSLHFLERLTQRVDGEQTELALRLYRDPALVKTIAQDPSVAAGAWQPEQRLAIPIAPGPDPPLVLVTAGGAFVTCLGPGMAPSGARVVPWRRVEFHVRRANLAAARQEEAAAALDAAGPHPLRRLLRTGDEMSREEMGQLLAIAPLYGDDLSIELMQLLLDIKRSAPLVMRYRPGRHLEARYANRWIRTFSASGHLCLLSASGGYDHLEFLEALPEATRVHRVQLLLYLAARGEGGIGKAALWAIARGGRHSLRCLQTLLASATTSALWLAAAYAIYALGIANERLRSEAARSLGGQGIPKQLEALSPFAHHMRDLMMNELPRAVDDLARQAASGAADPDADGTMIAALERRDPEDRTGARRAFLAGDRTLLTQIQSGCIAQAPGRLLDGKMRLQQLLSILSLMRLEPPDFHLPAAATPLFANPWTAERIREQATLWVPRPPPPVAAKNVPGRNEPCSCGSGKKYKRCCGDQGGGQAG